MVNWQDAYDIKFEDGTYNVYKKNSSEMLAYCNKEEDAIKVAVSYFKIVQQVADDFLLGFGDE